MQVTYNLITIKTYNKQQQNKICKQQRVYNTRFYGDVYLHNGDIFTKLDNNTFKCNILYAPYVHVNQRHIIYVLYVSV